MARTLTSAPHAACSAADTATEPAPVPVAASAGDRPAVAVLAALSAEPGGAAVTVIAGRAGISVAAARQALIAHEKNGTATRVEGGRPGVPDTWTRAAAPTAPGNEAPPAEAPGSGSTVSAGQSDAKPAAGTADTGQPAPAGIAAAQSGTAQGPDPALAAEAAGNVSAIAHAADEAGKALAAGNLAAALATLDAVRDLAAQGRRVIKGAASGRRASATRPGALRELVVEHLRKFPTTTFTPHQIGKVLTRSSGAVANALDKLVSLGAAELVSDKPRSYRLAPAAPVPEAAGDPGTSAETAASAA